jgi:hypothetical protein
MVENAGFSAGLKNRTKVERITWAWMGAKKNVKERRLNPIQAVSEGRDLSNKRSEKISKAGGGPGDVGVILIFAERDNLGKAAGRVVFEFADPYSESKDLVGVQENRNHVPVGYVIAVLDRQSGNFMVQALPIVLQDPALKLLEDVVDEVAKLKDWRLS